MFNIINTLSLDLCKQQLNYYIQFTLVVFATLIASGLCNQAAAEVIMFNQVPTVEELSKVIFPRKRTTRLAFFTSSTQQKKENGSNNNVIGLPIKFSFDSSELLQESKPYLDTVAKMLKTEQFSDQKIMIEGHADAMGTKNYNQGLSEKRANAVSAYLVKHYDIDASRLHSQGKGEQEPLENHAPYAPINRRVQIFKVK